MVDGDRTHSTTSENTSVVPENQRGERFAQLIRTARRSAGLSQDHVARQSGISRSQLMRWENGEAERPDPPTVRAVCLFLGIDPRDAAIALGYLTPDEAYGPPRFGPEVDAVLQFLRDPNVPEEDKRAFVRYGQLLRMAHDPRKHDAKPAG